MGTTFVDFGDITSNPTFPLLRTIQSELDIHYENCDFKHKDFEHPNHS